MRKNLINRSPEGDGGGAGIAEPVVVRGFDALSEITGIEEHINIVNSDPAPTGSLNNDGNQAGQNPGDVTPDPAANPAATSTTTDPIFNEAGDQVSATGEIIKSKADIDLETGIISEFKVGGEDSTIVESPEEKTRREALENLSKESNWVNLAKVHGAEIAENTFEAYEAAIKTKNEADKVTIFESAKAQVKDELLAEKPVEVMAILEGIEQGYTYEEIMEPKRTIEKLKSLSDAELIAEDCRLKNWSQELIDKHIEDLTTRDKLDVAAQPLRDILQHNEDNLAKQQLETFAALKQSKETKIAEARTRESEEIKNSLTSMKTFLDVPITENVVGHIQKKWNAGEYHEAFKDPKIISEFLMYREFGEQGLKNLKNREYQRGRDEKAKNLHNIPPVILGGGKVAGAPSVKADGNFGALPSS